MLYALRFHSDGGDNLLKRGNYTTGFQIEYKVLKLFTDCGGIFTNASGILSSPSYPHPYPNMADCNYIISQPSGKYINISFVRMDLICNAAGSDYIEIRDGNAWDSFLMGTFCGNGSNIPASIQTTQNDMRLRLGYGHT